MNSGPILSVDDCPPAVSPTVVGIPSESARIRWATHGVLKSPPWAKSLPRTTPSPRRTSTPTRRAAGGRPRLETRLSRAR
ncbi:hypothetical protein EHS14_05920 [Schaalia georgiae]|nr:hypothetical protein EHS14_05920 [Schaalia georgiae]